MRGESTSVVRCWPLPGPEVVMIETLQRRLLQLFAVSVCLLFGYYSLPFRSYADVEIHLENQLGYPLKGKILVTFLDRDGQVVEVPRDMTFAGNIYLGAGSSNAYKNHVTFETVMSVRSALIRAKNCEPSRVSIWFRRSFEGANFSLMPHGGTNAGYWLYKNEQTVQLNCVGPQ
jgi:hypothetical protein